MGENIWVLVPIAFVIGLVVRTWIRARYSYPPEDRGALFNAHHDGLSRQDMEKCVNEALVARDEKLAKLEERVRVLERIVTTKSHGLAEEIESLR